MSGSFPTDPVRPEPPSPWEVAAARPCETAPEPKASVPDALTGALYRRKLSLAFAGAVAAILLVCLTALGWMIADGNARVAVNQDSNMVLPVEDDDAVAPRKMVEPIDLPRMLGLPVDKALKVCGRGPDLVEERVVDQGGAVRLQTYALTQEKVSVRNEAVFLYLGTDADGIVVSAGLRAPFSNLGFSGCSFADAVGQLRVIQQVLADMGVAVKDSDIVLPEDPADYTVYESDNVTAISRHGEFSGVSQDADGSQPGVSRDASGSRSGVSQPLAWHAVIDFDYSEANAKRNMAYTRRFVEVHVGE